MRWWPRTVRWQLIVWLMLLEALSVGLFATILVTIEGLEIRQRALERLAHQATSVAQQAEEAYRVSASRAGAALVADDGRSAERGARQDY